MYVNTPPPTHPHTQAVLDQFKRVLERFMPQDSGAGDDADMGGDAAAADGGAAAGGGGGGGDGAAAASDADSEEEGEQLSICVRLCLCVFVCERGVLGAAV